MLYFIESINNDKAFYLVNQNEFIIGRKKCDILIEKDNSISKQHAKINIENDTVTIQDLGSKYKTSFNGTELTPNVAVQLKDKDNIHLGGLGSKYIFRQMNIVTTATQLSSVQKKALKKYLNVVQGKYVDNWNAECTYLTVEKISLTIKVLHALLEDKPTVVPDFWKEFAENVSKSLPPPDINAYNDPPLLEGLLNKVEFKSGIDRTNLFKDKIFLFTLEKEKAQVEELISKAGGFSVSWENDCEEYKKVAASSKYFLVMQSCKDIDDKAYKNIIKLLAKQNRRTIPVQEIAMAIIHGSCEKDCNPEFDRVQEVFARTDKEASQDKLLVKNTQTQQSIIDTSQLKRVIPETFNPDQTDAPPIKKRIVEKDFDDEISDVSAEKDKDTGKRVTANPHDSNPFKKIKLESTDTTKRSNDKSDVESCADNSNGFFSKKPTNGKRKVKEEDSDSDDSQPKKSLKNNPFGKFTLTKKSIQTEDNPFLSSKKLTGLSKMSDNALPSVPDDEPMDNTPQLTCTKEEPQEPGYDLHTTKTTECVTGWYSKNSSAHIKKEENEQYSTELQEFINLFKNKIVVDVLSEDSIRSYSVTDEVDCKSHIGTKNFKKFKKVKPLHPQRIIVGEEQFNQSQFGDTTGIHDSRKVVVYDSDEEQKPKSKQRKTLKSFMI